MQRSSFFSMNALTMHSRSEIANNREKGGLTNCCTSRREVHRFVAEIYETEREREREIQRRRECEWKLGPPRAGTELGQNSPSLVESV